MKYKIVASKDQITNVVVSIHDTEIEAQKELYRLVFISKEFVCGEVKPHKPAPAPARA
ncbi:hypothetical protein vB_PsyM_KIL4_0174 [Pseudomonas phage vB_PsyM_KIL4]|uniref:Uncharacterized protein n=2 Tax=Flaumdravirus TaxID=2560133 RepID=A0A142IF93_9CAUD|nr:hypothetical protein FDI83_gp039 [Pseudomonas phage vB_PsyM_KIL4]AMR57898.1 hypothetical protein vB_PsyM_KIL4_0174 [Pseudomonas phage vB_PsyM_KIL4]AMR58068.1 hypothetical protein vB_PsyM_KIL5_0177 [Pseudomonas phage vB_PsyM_KIL5]